MNQWVISWLKSMFMRCGIPIKLISANGSHFVWFRDFQTKYDIIQLLDHTTLKRMVLQRQLYRQQSTFFTNLIHSWFLWATRPPKWVQRENHSTAHDWASGSHYYSKVCKRVRPRSQDCYQHYYNRRHSVCLLPEIHPGEQAWSGKSMEDLCSGHPQISRGPT